MEEVPPAKKRAFPESDGMYLFSNLDSDQRVELVIVESPAGKALAAFPHQLESGGIWTLLTSDARGMWAKVGGLVRREESLSTSGKTALGSSYVDSLKAPAGEFAS